MPWRRNFYELLVARARPLSLAANHSLLFAVSFPALTFIDLVAGMDGIRLGFEAAAGRCVYTSEGAGHARRAHAANFPDSQASVGAITQVDRERSPHHEALLAGFSCQPFSIAGAGGKSAKQAGTASRPQESA